MNMLTKAKSYWARRWVRVLVGLGLFLVSGIQPNHPVLALIGFAGLIILFVELAKVIFGRRRNKVTQQPTSSPALAQNKKNLPHGVKAWLDGDGNYRMEVVGESHYRSAFEKITGPRTDESVDYECEAEIVLEDTNKFDDQAVAVRVKGHKVGYLSRDNARAYRTLLAQTSVGLVGRASCNAVIRGGWDRDEEDQGHYGVWLDLPVKENNQNE